MESSSDAIKMVFGILVMISALGIVIFAFTKVRVTATAVLDKSDKNTYYQIYDPNDGSNKQYNLYRKVGIDTVIANLYSYYGNFYTILFYNGKDAWDDENFTFSRGSGEVVPIRLYDTEALDNPTGDSPNRNWLTQLGRSTLRIGNNTRQIYGLDINDELTRQEPWSHNERNDKLFIDALINGRPWIWPNWSRSYVKGENEINQNSQRIRYLKIKFHYMAQLGNRTLAECKNSVFIERIGQYNYDAQYTGNDEDSEGQGALSGTSGYGRYNETNQTDSTIQFEDENGSYVGEIANNKITQKKVIQYIYIGEADADGNLH